MTSIIQYRVFITPLVKRDIYGSEIEITEFVLQRSFGKIKKSIDDGDFDIGIYTYSDLTLTLSNITRIFNDETDSSSIFPYLRDRTKVRISYTDSSDVESDIYEGIVNDEATRQNLDKDEIKVRVLSLDSILSKVNVAGGLISDNNTFEQAIKAVLNRPSIKAVLNYDPNNINVGYNGVIDDASVFSANNSRNVLTRLLNASGSIFYVDDSNNMIVSDRSVKGTPLELYGAGDLQERNNIVKITKYNNGLQRTFNTIKVNETTVLDQVYIDRFGAGLKSFSFEFITNPNTESDIATYYLNQFKTPRLEAEVEVKSDLATNVNILDEVSLDYQKIYKPYKGSPIPISGSSIAGQSIAPYIINGSSINPNKRWKVIGIDYNIKSFTTILKLREV